MTKVYIIIKRSSEDDYPYEYEWIGKVFSDKSLAFQFAAQMNISEGNCYKDWYVDEHKLV